MCPAASSLPDKTYQGQPGRPQIAKHCRWPGSTFLWKPGTSTCRLLSDHPGPECIWQRYRLPTATQDADLATLAPGPPARPHCLRHRATAAVTEVLARTVATSARDDSCSRKSDRH